MSRTSDPNSPAAANLPEPGDCIADVGAELLEEVAAYHGYAEPPHADVAPEELA
jgi:hypothetical protein